MVFISFLVYLVVLSAAEEKELKSSRIIVDLSISFFFYGFSLTYFAVLFPGTCIFRIAVLLAD